MTQPRFSPGDLVHHRKFDYRGVVVDVDPEFAGSEEWYEYMASVLSGSFTQFQRTRPGL